MYEEITIIIWYFSIYSSKIFTFSIIFYQLLKYITSNHLILSYKYIYIYIYITYYLINAKKHIRVETHILIKFLKLFDFKYNRCVVIQLANNLTGHCENSHLFLILWKHSLFGGHATAVYIKFQVAVSAKKINSHSSFIQKIIRNFLHFQILEREVIY